MIALNKRMTIISVVTQILLLERHQKKIKSLGATPALWTGATNEGVLNEMLTANPQWVLGHKAIWCGQYWVDLTNPEVLEKYIKKCIIGF